MILFEPKFEGATYANWDNFIAMVISLFSSASTADGITYESAKEIFPSGEQDDCLFGPYIAKPNDQWLVVVKNHGQWSIQKAVVSREGKLDSKTGTALWFIKNEGIPVKIGAILSSPITQRESNVKFKHEYTFTFMGKSYSWIELGWSELEFFLTDGRVMWATVDKLTLGEVEKEIPAKFIKEVKNEVHASEENEAVEDYVPISETVINWAGDLNGDGLLDLIVYSGAIGNSAGNYSLWIGTLSSNQKLTFERLAHGMGVCD